MSKHEIVCLSAVRTPMGRFGGSLSRVSASELGAQAIRAAVERSGLPVTTVEEVFMGCVVSAGLGQNPARQASLKAGMPVGVPATTVNMVCGSGAKAIDLAVSALQSDRRQIVVAGGMESMSNAPHLLRRVRTGVKLGNDTLEDALLTDGLTDAFGHEHMGTLADGLAEKLSIGREKQDRYALASHERALRATEEGRFEDELLSVRTRSRRGEEQAVMIDEGPRADTSLERLSGLRPAFAPEGTVTAGNASQLSDGAAALVLTTRGNAEHLGLRPLASVDRIVTHGVAPADFLTAPAEAILRLLAATGFALEQCDLYEINEAFAVQAITVADQLGLPADRLNVNGGAIALGHPIGCTGARILTTLIHSLVQRDLDSGIAALCVGGGYGLAALVRRCC
jgi:acetyl-CoA C-acetyltransferase